MAAPGAHGVQAAAAVPRHDLAGLQPRLGQLLIDGCEHARGWSLWEQQSNAEQPAGRLPPVHLDDMVALCICKEPVEHQRARLPADQLQPAARAAARRVKDLRAPQPSAPLTSWLASHAAGSPPSRPVSELQVPQCKSGRRQEQQSCIHTGDVSVVGVQSLRSPCYPPPPAAAPVTARCNANTQYLIARIKRPQR